MKDSQKRQREGAPEQVVLEKKTRVKRYLGIGSLGIAAAFLFLPDLAIFDFLPDFIGYIILLSGISQLRDLNDYFGDAYDRFYKVAWISGLRFLSFFVVLGLVTPQERPDTMLLIAFVFGVFDFLYLIPAWKYFFEGFSYLTARYEGAAFESIPRKPKRARRSNPKKGIRKGDLIERKPLNRIERIRRLTVFFVGFKTVLNVLPEFAALTADTETGGVFQLYRYITLLRGVAMAAVVVLGTVWLVSLIRFVLCVRRDRAFLAHYREKYRTEVLTKDHIFIHRHLQNALFVASLAMVFRLDFRLDNLHVLPDAVMAILLILSVVLLGGHVGRRRPFVITAGVFAVISVASNLYEFYFHNTFSVTAIQTDVEANEAFVTFCAIKVMEQVLFLVVFYLFSRLMQNVIRSYTGFSVTEQETRTPSEKIKQIHRELEKKLNLVELFAILTAISKTLTVLLMLYSRPGRPLEWLPVVDFVLAAVFAVVSVKTIREIYSQVEYRFMLL